MEKPVAKSNKENSSIVVGVVVVSSILLFSISLFAVFKIALNGSKECTESGNCWQTLSEGLHADLTRSVVRSSNWMKQYYMANTTSLRPYRAASMIAVLRIAGNLPHTLLSDFKDRKALSIHETLKTYLDQEKNDNGDLKRIPAGRLAHIIQAVISTCKNPDDFYGHNLTQALYFGFSSFKETPTFGKYFRYSLAVIALCNAGHSIPNYILQELINGACRNFTYYSVDIDSLILTALSCIKDCSMQAEVNRASRKIVERLISHQNKTTGVFGNQYSTALAVQALQAARIHSDVWRCDKALRNILSYQDKDGSFGTILANIQVTPALLGESLISLKKFSCPLVEDQKPTLPPKMITVAVKLFFNTSSFIRTEPAVYVTVPEGTTAYNILELAKLENPCYTATYKRFSFGRSITSICDTASKPKKGYFWLIDVNGSPAKYGVDGLKPKDNSVITFQYKKISF